ncbi:MAG: lysylphosphatidylglycerol synthase transmembrane domain-containing protein [Spirochaetota bacterium]
MKKFGIGIFISLFFIFLLANKFDREVFNKVWALANLYYIIPAVFIQLMGLFFSSLRWFVLLKKQLPLKHAISCSVIGGGGNMVLPARGGDLFRMYYCKYEAEIPYFSLLSRLFLEKVMDFVYVILIGILAFTYLQVQNQSTGNYTIFTVLGIITLGVFIGLYLLRFQNAWLHKIAKFLFNKLGREEFFHKHISQHLQELESFLQIKNLLIPLLLTMSIWLFYSIVYYILPMALGMQFSYEQAVFILFMAAMSMAVPSAPSGIGVFHASVLSGFIILALPEQQGLVFATLAHFFNFLVASLSGLVFYLYWMYKRRHGKPVNLQEVQNSIEQ